MFACFIKFLSIAMIHVNVFRFFGSCSFCEDGCEEDVTYACEFCRTKYNSYAEAEACEAHREGGKAKKTFLIHMYYRYHM